MNSTYEPNKLHPPLLINAATLPCESQKVENACEHNLIF